MNTVNEQAAAAALLEGQCQALANADRVYGVPLVSEGFVVVPGSDRLTLLRPDGAVQCDHERLSVVISLTPEGVEIKPIVDRKRVLLTFLATLAIGLLALARHR